MNAKILTNEEIDIEYLQGIYKTYCEYKKFKSVMPLFESEFYNNDIIAYYDNDKIEAFSMIGKYDNKNVENFQFAWTYHNPDLMLGIKNFSIDIENQLHFLKIFSLINQKCSELSGGELQRVAYPGRNGRNFIRKLK